MTKRKQFKSNIGHIEERGPNSFRADVSINGQRFRQVFSTGSSAENWLRGLERKVIADGGDGFAKAELTTLLELLYNHANYGMHNRPIDAISKYESLKFTLEAIGLADKAVSRVQTSDIARLRDARLRDGICPSGKPLGASTINKDLSFISKAFGVARAEHGYDGLENPVIKEIRCKPPRVEFKRIPQHHLELILEQAAKYETQPLANIPIVMIIKFALLTCCRLGEVCLLRWENVDSEGRKVYLPPAHSKSGEGRQVLLVESARQILDFFGRKESGPLVGFPPSSVRQAWGRVITRAGFPQYNFHTLRHESCSRLAERGGKVGMSESEMRQISGHKTAAMFARYVHLTSDTIIDKYDGLGL